MDTSKEILIGFFKEMHQWEINSLKSIDEKGILIVRDEVREGLVNIYERYLTKPGGKSGRLNGPSVGYPPEYDEKLERILSTEEVNSRKIIITTLWQHPAVSDFTREQRYTLSLKGSDWMISKKEVFRSASGKWENLVF